MYIKGSMFYLHLKANEKLFSREKLNLMEDMSTSFWSILIVPPPYLKLKFAQIFKIEGFDAKGGSWRSI